jgi:glycosyltransferase involved in cell wall biosynthesis
MHVLFIEPFCGGSHGAFLRTLSDGLRERFDVRCTVLSMPARHWKWRMRGAVPWLAQEHDAELCRSYDLVFASSFLALAELVGLYPHLGSVPRVLYFHENQLTYPVRAGFSGERDHHFGFTQMVSALAATRCVFNSEFNRQSFLDAGQDCLARMPDAVPDKWRQRVASASDVIGLPLELPELAGTVFRDAAPDSRACGPIILWNHRWEHDKNPAEFFAALLALRAASVPFRIAVCGESFSEIPKAMARAKLALADQTEHWGFLATRADYLALLSRAQIAVSTSNHEFFGVSAIEAAWMGARPLVPDRLSYPELFAAEFRYRELLPELERMCRGWRVGDLDLREDRRSAFAKHRAGTVVAQFHEFFVKHLAAPHERTP